MDELYFEECVEWCFANPMEISTMQMNSDCLTNNMRDAITAIDNGLYYTL